MISTETKVDIEDLAIKFEAFQKAEKVIPESDNHFPISVFPSAMQEIAKATHQDLNYPFDFIGSAMLAAASVGIGNTFKAQIKPEMEASAVLTVALIGPPGSNKSQPLNFALAPIAIRDAAAFRKYQLQMSEYNKAIKVSNKRSDQEEENETHKPILGKFIVSDFTPEALALIHYFNSRGIIVYIDELAAFFNNMNRYNKGSEEQFWLSVWSGSQICIDRKSSEPISITQPFILIIGTMQPGVIKEYAAGRTANGFFDRILFAVPENLKKERWSDTELDPVHKANWSRIINNLLDLVCQLDSDNNPSPMILKFTSESKKILFEWNKENTDASNGCESDAVKGIRGKMDIYTPRFALILEMLSWACDSVEMLPQNISVNSVEGAIRLAEYFTASAIKVRAMISEIKPLDLLTLDKRNLYDALPALFTKKEGADIATREHSRGF
jgi:hypothetical protein